MRKDKKPTADKAILGETHLEIQGARVHNLRNIDISIPRDKLVLITGLSGSRMYVFKLIWTFPCRVIN